MQKEGNKKDKRRRFMQKEVKKRQKEIHAKGRKKRIKGGLYIK